MSDFTDSFVELYDCQTATTGTAYTATVGGITGRALMRNVGIGDKLGLSAFDQVDGLTFEMLASDFNDTIPKPQSAVEILDMANLYMADCTPTNGVYYITAQHRTSGK